MCEVLSSFYDDIYSNLKEIRIIINTGIKQKDL